MNAETVVRQDQVAELIDRLATAERQRDAALDALRQIDDEDGRQFFLPANMREVYRAAIAAAQSK